MLTYQIWFTFSDKGISKAQNHVILPVKNRGNTIRNET